jgi:hypothetical protein
VSRANRAPKQHARTTIRQIGDAADDHQPLVPELAARMKTSNELLNGLPQRQSKLELPVVNESISIRYSDWVQTIMSSKLDRQYPDWFRHSLANEVLGIYSKSFPPGREQRLPIISEPQSQVFARSYTFENSTDRSQTSRTGGF